MKQISSMFLRNITCIDHASVDSNGFIEGGSYHQEIIVTGEIDDKEQVVVDFSKIKKQIKSIIDDKETGFDHKLWINKDWSDCELFDLNDNYVRVVSPHFVLEAPRNAIKVVKRFFTPESQMQKEIEEGLNRMNNTDNIRVELLLTKEPFSYDPVKFTYFHGLKNSSSWGCNNIAHGHTSFIEAYDSSGLRVEEVENIIAHHLDGAMMIFKENLVEPNRISYETPRGRFSLSFSDDVKRIYMEKETTIENIVEYVWEKFEAVLDYYDVQKMFISEGLQKGAFKKKI